MFLVEWVPRAEKRLAEIWTNASDRALVAAAADEIDAALAGNPSSIGESRDRNTRIVFAKPLAVLFDVDEANRRVRVWDIWRWPR
jgi:plasmid stabilization system protein ParE